MPVKYKSNCAVCQRIKQDKSVMKRLYECKMYVRGGVSVLQLTKELGFSYPSLNNHLKKHQAISDDDLTQKELQQIQKRQAGEMVQKVIKTSEARQNVLDQLVQMVEEKGEIKVGEDISVKDALNILLKAAKDADDVQAKKKDQDIDVFKLMTSARSGEKLPIQADDTPFDPWAIQAADYTEAEVVE